MTRHRIVFYTRSPCHLCDVALGVLDRVVTGRQDVEVSVVDIDTDPDLVVRYNHDVPVVILNGREVARHRLDESILRARLTVQ
jgi:glutaredoxin